jgi:hypothetical protein
MRVRASQCAVDWSACIALKGRMRVRASQFAD